jgi:hypothetical protein
MPLRVRIFVVIPKFTENSIVGILKINDLMIFYFGTDVNKKVDHLFCFRSILKSTDFRAADEVANFF